MVRGVDAGTVTIENALLGELDHLLVEVTLAELQPLLIDCVRCVVHVFVFYYWVLVAF